MTPLRPFSDQDRLSWLRLARTPRIGPVTFERLIQRYKTSDAALQALPSLKPGGPKPPSTGEVEKEIADISAYGARILCSGETGYPPLLLALGAPPPILNILGNLDLASKPTVAIVGARYCSATWCGRVRDRFRARQRR